MRNISANGSLKDPFFFYYSGNYITLRVIRGILIAKLFCSNVISTQVMLKQFIIFERCVMSMEKVHNAPERSFSVIIDSPYEVD